MVNGSRKAGGDGLELARILIVDDDPASRLTLQTVLEAGGYRVDCAATAAEAVGKMDDDEYEVVLSDLQMESPEAGLRVLAHAQLMSYHPATALVTTYRNLGTRDEPVNGTMLVEPENIPDLLSKVAYLIADRATRQVERQLKAVLRN